MVDTVQQIGDIGSKVFFESISLSSNTPSPIYAESLTGGSIDVRSLGGAIRGTFNSTKTLQLTTSNAPIMVSVNLNDTDIFGAVTPSIYATTSNRQATIGLFRSTYPGATNLGRYFVSAQTSNSPIGLEFKAAPLHSALDTVASTTNSPVTVVTHPTYEGDFSLSTTIGEAEIDESPGTVDPSGKGRSRQFQYTDIKQGVLKGTVYWGEEKPTWPFPGYPTIVPGITMSTTNSPVILVL
ncbi:hypothetical protein HYPSUDRAFT_196880 [Hypholoma sublateritium FD-334 SS-4]|uniref:Uncharacterized protein n=1 Tax=Hypholoma sublateritium (strain FD-334 SS-4) TaxID=945553 RepID=A0A0D2PD16_HYPSF|nr:hypothetical protein HYPSUDRAFT_196880 [Hypholoma sublateritium FD-334 SS-4]